MTIRTKLTILFIAIAAMPLFSLGVLGGFGFSQTLLERERLKLSVLAETTEQRLLTADQSHREQLGTFSHRLQMKRQLQQYLRTPNQASVDFIRQVLIEATAGIAHDINYVSILDPQGKVLASTQLEQEGRNLSDTDYFLAGKEGNSTNLYYLDNERLSIRLVGPLTIDDEFIGVVLVDQPADELLQLVESIEGLGQTGEITLAWNFNGDPYWLTPTRFRPDLSLTPIQLAITPDIPMASALNRQTGVGMFESDYRNEPVLAAHRYIDSLGLGIVVKTDQSEILVPIQQIQRSLLFLAGILISFAALVALVTAKTITDPINSLVGTARQLSAGKLSVRAKEGTDGEVGELANSFNRMAQKLQTLYENLANQVKEKTQEVLEQNQALQQKNALLLDTQTAITNILEDLEQANAQMDHDRAQAQAMLSSIGDGVFALDTTGKIILFNQAAEEISGYSSTEAIGRHYREVFVFINPDRTRMGDAFIQSALQGRKTSMDSHTVLISKTGEEIPVADSAAPIIGPNNQVEGVVVVFRNVSRERQLEHMKDEFVSIASHELRTPMTAMKGLVSMIQEGDFGDVPPPLSEPIRDIGASTERLIQLVNDLLNVSRIESGRLRFDIKKIPLNQLVKEVVGNLLPLALESKIDLRVLEDQNYEIQADPDKVRQILNNLLGNALKFTKQGSVSVFFKDEPDAVVVFIKDSGQGISADDQKRLFKKFEQITSQEAGRPAGTGLGLYISTELAQKMGGSLWIESSQPGVGSIFALRLPKPDSAMASQALSSLKADQALIKTSRK